MIYKKPLLIVKPRFIPMVAVLTGGIIPAVCFTGFAMILYGNAFAWVALDHNLPGWFTYLFFGCFFFFVTITLTCWVMMNVWKNTEYKFYSTYLVCYKGFLKITKKTINYSEITKITLEGETVHKLYGLGTIVLSVPSFSEEAGISNYGIYMTYIYEPEEILEQIKYYVTKGVMKKAA